MHDSTGVRSGRTGARRALLDLLVRSRRPTARRRARPIQLRPSIPPYRHQAFRPRPRTNVSEGPTAVSGEPLETRTCKERQMSGVQRRSGGAEALARLGDALGHTLLGQLAPSTRVVGLLVAD